MYTYIHISSRQQAAEMYSSTVLYICRYGARVSLLLRLPIPAPARESRGYMRKGVLLTVYLVVIVVIVVVVVVGSSL